MRRFLEPILKRDLVEQDVVKIWVRDANGWLRTQPASVVEKLYAEYGPTLHVVK